VWNKLDRLSEAPDPRQLARWSDGHPWVALSTRDAAAVAALEAKLIAAARSQEEELCAFVPYTAASTLSLIFANCRVIGNDATDAGLNLRLQGPPAVMSRIKHSLGKANP
jgi:50S ribosomal subunit-associated GTPase HflX